MFHVLLLDLGSLLAPDNVVLLLHIHRMLGDMTCVVLLPLIDHVFVASRCLVKRCGLDWVCVFYHSVVLGR